VLLKGFDSKWNACNISVGGPLGPFLELLCGLYAAPGFFTRKKTLNL
jgi:hypothetical protein